MDTRFCLRLLLGKRMKYGLIPAFDALLLLLLLLLLCRFRFLSSSSFPSSSLGMPLSRKLCFKALCDHADLAKASNSFAELWDQARSKTRAWERRVRLDGVSPHQ